MRIRTCLYTLAVLVALGAAAILTDQSVSAHMMFLKKLYPKPRRLKGAERKYDKADLPSARVRHPVLEPKPWWRRPKSEWLAARETWPAERRKRVGASIDAMERELERMRTEARGRAGKALSMSEERLARYVPPQTPIEFRRNYCPACGEGKLAWAGESGWDQVKCDACGMVFPNKDYPADRKHMTWPVRLWPYKAFEFTFMYHRDKKGFNHFFEALTYAPKRRIAMDHAIALAEAYHLTGDDRYARRAAVILDAIAKVYPSWMMSNGEHPLQYQSVGAIPTESTMHLFETWLAGLPYKEAQNFEPVYDRIYHSPALDQLSVERGYDVREFVERDLFYHNLVFYLSNVAPFGGDGPRDGSCVFGVARKGKVLNDAELVHRCHHWAEMITHGAYRADGAADGTVEPDRPIRADVLDVVREIEGWTDPPGHVDKWGGHRFENYAVDRDFPLSRQSHAIAGAIDYPDGRPFPVNDTSDFWPGQQRDGACAVLPSWGHAVLGTGAGASALQGHLRMPASGLNAHRDALSIALFAHGRELLADIGGRRSSLRERWVAHTASHSTVVIDGRPQAARPADASATSTACELTLYAPNAGGLSVVEARAERCYRDVASEYRRMLILVTIDPERPYFVDVFRVAGGRTHDYMLHGSADHAQNATLSLDLTQARDRLRAPLPADALRDTYSLLDDVRGASTDDPWTATFANRDGGAGVRVTVLGGARTDAFVCGTPSVRRAPHGAANEVDFTRPTVIARRRGDEGHASTFVSVIEPFVGDAPGTRARLLDATGGDGALALRVEAGGRTDTIMIARDGPGRVTTGDGYTLDGRVGLVSENGHGPAAACVVDGSRVAHAETATTTDAARFAGTIHDTTRTAAGAELNAFVTDAALPEGDALSGSWITLSHGDWVPGEVYIKRLALGWLRFWRRAAGPGRARDDRPFTSSYEIDRVERRDGKSWIVTKGIHGLTVARHGLWYEIFDGTWNQIPDLTGAKPRDAGIVRHFDWAPYFGSFNFCYRLTGSIDVPTDGTYAFTIDRVHRMFRLTVGGTVVLDKTDPESYKQIEGTVDLTAGRHAVEMLMVESQSPQDLDVFWAGPRIEKARVPHEALLLPEDVTYEVYAPERRFKGHDSFVIRRSAATSLAPPNISPDGAEFQGSVEVGLAPGTTHGLPADGLEIRYTTDGGDPSRQSTLYAGPFSLSASATVKARCFAGAWASHVAEARFEAPRPAFTLDENAAVAGLAYRYWEARGGTMVDFASHPPLATGTVDRFTLEPVRRAAKRPTDFAIEFTGFVRVPRDGAYTFATFAEGAASIAVVGVRVVDQAIGREQPALAKGTIALAAGFHPIAVLYVSGGEGDSTPRKRGFRVGYTGPKGVKRDQIRFYRPADRVRISPAAGFFEGPFVVTIDKDTPRANVRFTLDGSEPTARSRRYRRPFKLKRAGTVKACVVGDDETTGPVVTVTWADAPAAAALGPDGTTNGLLATVSAPGVAARLTATESVELAEPSAGAFSQKLQGYFVAPEDAAYTFYLTCRDRGEIVLDGTSLVTSSDRRAAAGTRPLRAGAHALHIEYAKSDGRRGRCLSVEFEGGGVSRRPLAGEFVKRPLDLVRFDTNDGRFYRSGSVRLVPERAGAPVRFTTDGSDPTAQSPLATDEITVTRTTTLKARVFSPAPGAVNAFTMTRLEPRAADATGALEPGLTYEYFEGEWTTLPSFDALEPVAAGDAARFDVTPAARKHSFALRFRGFIDVAAVGLYTFHLNSDDGSRLYIGGELVVDNDGEHPKDPGASGRIALSAGKHALEVTYFAGSHGDGLVVGYEGPGVARRAIPDAALFREK